MNVETNTTATEAAAATVAGKQVTFFFKKSPIRDADGKKIGEGRKHPDVVAVLPMPLTMDDVVAAITAQPKVADLVIEALQATIYDAARAQINSWREENGDDADFSADKFDLSKLELTFLATVEKASRAGYTPSEEELKAFCEDYAEVVLGTGYDAKKVQNHCDLYKKGMNKVKASKPTLSKLVEVLQLYAARTANMADHEQVFGWLVARAERWINAEEKDYSDAV